MKSLTFSLYSSRKTVFTAQEISILLKETSMNNLKAKINYFVKKGILIALKRGLYAKNNGFDILEAANKILTPSYISLETVLLKEGINFQYYDKTIFVISYQTREVALGEYTISFNKMKDEILNSPMGIINTDGYSIASPERAFLDRIYLSGNYHFDNLGQIDWKLAKNLVKIYNNKAMERRFKSYVNDFFASNNND